MPRSHNDELRAYRRTARALPLLLFVYSAIVLWRELEPGRGEVFPFASWSLFTLVPNETRDFALRVRAIDGVPLPEPVFYEESAEHFAMWHGHAPHVAIDRMGRAFEAGEMESVEAIRVTFERLFMCEAREVQYELVERHFDPIERFRTGKFVGTRTLKQLHKAPR